MSPSDDLTEIIDITEDDPPKNANLLDQLSRPKLFLDPSLLPIEALREFSRACRRVIKTINRLARAMVSADPPDGTRLVGEACAEASRLAKMARRLKPPVQPNEYATSADRLEGVIVETITLALLGDHRLLVSEPDLIRITNQARLAIQTEMQIVPPGQDQPQQQTQQESGTAVSKLGRVEEPARRNSSPSPSELIVAAAEVPAKETKSKRGRKPIDGGERGRAIAVVVQAVENWRDHLPEVVRRLDEASIQPPKDPREGEQYTTWAEYLKCASGPRLRAMFSGYLDNYGKANTPSSN